MRVSSSSFSNNFLLQINQLQQRQQTLQTQATTGQKVTLPEDDPSVMGQVLDQQAQSSAYTQYQSNITALQNTATTSYTAITGLKTTLDSATEIATEAGGTVSNDQLDDYANQVEDLIKQALQTANTQDSQGNYVFAGTASTSPPFVATTDANGNITGVTYQGNTDANAAEIAPNSTLTAQTVGANTSGSGPRGLITDSRYGADYFNHLISLQQDLSSHNTAAIASTDTPALNQDEDNILYHISANGVVQSHLTAATDINAQQSSSLTSSMSQETSADLATTITALDQTQTSYQAALQSGTMILNLSILNYLQ